MSFTIEMSLGVCEPVISFRRASGRVSRSVRKDVSMSAIAGFGIVELRTVRLNKDTKNATKLSGEGAGSFILIVVNM